MAYLWAAKDMFTGEIWPALYDGYAGPKRIWEIPEANHWTVTLRTPEDWKEIVDFWHGKSS